MMELGYGVRLGHGFSMCYGHKPAINIKFKQTLNSKFRDFKQVTTCL